MKVKTGIVTGAVAISLTAGLLPSAAMAAPVRTGAATVYSTTTQSDAAAVDSQLTARAGSLRAGMSAAEVAGTLFPEDAAARQQYVKQVNEIQAAPAGAQAVPAALAVFLPLLARCMWGALEGSVIHQIIYLAHHGHTASAETLLHGALAGCISRVIPGPLRWLANASKHAIVKAVLWIVIQLGPK